MPKKKFTAAFVDKVKSDKQVDYYDQHTNGLGLRVSPGGTKTFFYRYRFNGKNRRYSINRYSDAFTLSNARTKVNELRSYVKRGGDPVGEEHRARKREAIEHTTFKELSDQFKSIHLKTLRDNTRDEYIRIIDNELIPALGDHPVNDITKGQIITLLDNKAIKDGKATMANRIRARLHSIFEFGMHRELAKTNPVSGIKPYPEGETRRERFYSEKEIRHLWIAFNQVEEPAASVMKMLLLTGQRKTETAHMMWNNINGDVWTIPAELAKGKRTHDVPLSDMALDILDTMKQMNEDSQYVFSSPVLSDEPIKELKRQVKNVRDYTGKDDFKVDDFRLHDLRRTAATYMAKLNVDRTVLGKILNHKGLSGDGQVTAIYDRHCYLKEKRQALQQWGNKVHQIITGKTKILKIG